MEEHMRRLALVLVLGIGAFGCGTTRAAAPLERPLLIVPPPPPRIVEAPPVASVARPDPEPEIEPVPPLQPETRVPPARTRAASPRELPPKEAQKPEVKHDVAVVDPAAAEPPAPPAPAPLLRTPATADPAAAERQIRDTLDKARKVLNSVDYGRLSDLRKKAYLEVQDFITEAEAAIKASNFELGRELADKAEKFARELQARSVSLPGRALPTLGGELPRGEVPGPARAVAAVSWFNG